LLKPSFTYWYCFAGLSQLLRFDDLALRGLQGKQSGLLLLVDGKKSLRGTLLLAPGSFLQIDPGDNIVDLE